MRACRRALRVLWCWPPARCRRRWGPPPPHATQHFELATGNPVITAAVHTARDEGVRDGELKRARESVRTVLATRGLTLTDAQRARVESCDDLNTLTRWLQRAVVASTTDDVFD